MREIKFRVFDKIKKQMHPVTKISFTGLNQEARRIHFNEIHRCIEDCVLMQYTGLKDRHGVEIYEGDIVKGLAGTVREIIFQSGAFTFDGTPLGWDISVDDDKAGIEQWDTAGWAEVVGNIHESEEE